MTRESQTKKSTGSDDPSDLSVTVCIAPRGRLGSKTLNRELRMIRSALLYADHVELVSTSAAMYDTFQPLTSVDIHNPWADIRRLPRETLARIVGPKNVTSFRRTLGQVDQWGPNDPRMTELVARYLPDIKDAIQEAQRIYNAAHTPDLELARSRGALTTKYDEFDLEDSGDAHLDWFRERLSRAWNDPNGSVLLDNKSRRLLKASGADSDLRPWHDRSKRGAVGTGFIEHLPTFPDAPMEHVLEVRKELEGNRRRYRIAVKHLSEEISANALDPSLPSTIRELWFDEVQPEISALRKTVSLSRFGRRTGKRVLTDAIGSLRGGTFTVAVAELTNMLQWQPTIAATGGASAYIVGTALQEVMSARAERQSHDLVYLADVSKRLQR